MRASQAGNTAKLSCKTGVKGIGECVRLQHLFFIVCSVHFCHNVLFSRVIWSL